MNLPLYFVFWLKEAMKAARDKVLRFLGTRRMEKTAICLNLDVLIYLFNLLDKHDLTSCARVCKRWRNAAYHPSLWKEFLFYIKPSDIANDLTTQSLKERNITALMLRCSALTTDYQDSHSETSGETDFPSIVNRLTEILRVDSLVICHAPLSSDWKHKDIPIKHKYGTSLKFAPAPHPTSLNPTASFLVNLRSLVLLDANSIIDTLLQCKPLRSFENMRQVIIHALPCGYTKKKYRNTECGLFDSIFALFPKLSDLELAGDYFCESDSWLQLRGPIEPNRYLRRLALLNLGILSNGIVIMVAEGFPQITSLELVDVSNSKDHTFTRVVELPNLVSLRLPGCSSANSFIALIAMFRGCPKLTKLNLCLDNDQ